MFRLNGQVSFQMVSRPSHPQNPPLDAVYTCTYTKAMEREYDFSKAKRGPVVSVPKGKTRITIRLDDDILEWFREQVNRSGGGNYQTLINDALRQHIRRAQEPLEVTLRRVIREELKDAS